VAGNHNRFGRRVLTAADAREAAWIMPPGDLPDPGPGESRDLSAFLQPGRRYGVGPTKLHAFLVIDRSEPDVVADFVQEKVTIRSGRNLVEFSDQRKGRLTRWVLWGPLVESPDHVLVVGSLSIAPALPETDRDVKARGVTTELLRLVSPAAIVSEALRLLRRGEHLSRSGEQLRGQAIPVELQRAYKRLRKLSTVASGTSEDELRSIAERYCVLCARGLTRPLPQLAAEFGLTRDQARDRVRRARELHYLEPGRRGLAVGIPGPMLLAKRPDLEQKLNAIKRQHTKGGTDG
jgi:hypothetical protein